MAAIFEEVTLAWDGQEHTVRPDYKMVQRIEGRGISIFGVYQSIARGEPRITQVAEIISELLRSGGAKKATPEKVYQHIVQGSSEEWERIAAAIVAVFLPKETRSPNSAAPGDGGNQK